MVLSHPPGPHFLTWAGTVPLPRSCLTVQGIPAPPARPLLYAPFSLPHLDSDVTWVGDSQ